jgi:arylsulfatase A-like enzyme
LGISLGADEKPNVIIFFIDDLGYGDISPFGSDIPTPNLDRLANEGMVCKDAYVTNPPCCPSRTSLIMGMYGQRFGKYGMSRDLPVPEDKQNMAQFMNQNGYVTGQIGKWDIGSKQQDQLKVGFHEVLQTPPKKSYKKFELTAQNKYSKTGKSKFIYINQKGEEQWLTDYDGDRCVEWIEKHKEKLFFMYFTPEAVNSSNVEATEDLKRRSKITDPKRVHLAAAIVSVDDQVGKILDTLDRLNLREKTLFIFSSDNGPNLGEHGTAHPYRGGKGGGTQEIGWTLSPTIISRPGTVPQGGVYEGMMCTLDFYATMIAQIGAEKPTNLDGVDVTSYLKGEKSGDAHEFIFWQNSDPADSEHRHMLAVRWKDWRLYKKYGEDQWKLFDIKKDPQEKTDVASANPEVIYEMEQAYKAWKEGNTPVRKVPKVPKTKSRIGTGYKWVTAEVN